MKLRKKVLINCDDVGMHPAINEATKLLFKKGPIRSASLLATGPAFKHAADCFLDAGLRSIGVHLSLTSEYPDLEQIPVCHASQIPSLVTTQGGFYRTVKEVSQRAQHEEVYLEWRAQIQKIRKAGFELTHLDGHMFCYEPGHAQRADLLDVVIQLSDELKIPYRELQPKRTLLPERCVQKWATPSALSDYEKILQGEFDESCIELIIHPSVADEDFSMHSQNAERRLQDFHFFYTKNYDFTTIEILGWADVLKSRLSPKVSLEKATQIL